MSKVSSVQPVSNANALFSGGGQMGALMRAHDWNRTPLGPPESWPHSLRTAVRIILLSQYPMFVWWGKELINLYNDRYVPVLGKKHPASLGQSAWESWKEIWSAIGPRVDAVMKRGEATFDESLLLMMDRYGYVEETYFTFSYSPLPDDDGEIGGLFCAVTEETGRVIGERRMALLRKIASATADARTVEAVCDRAAECLQEANLDLPFALVYLRDSDGKLRLACESGISENHPAAPAMLEPSADEPWPVTGVLSSLAPVTVDDLSARFAALPAGGWNTPPEQAMLVPLAQQGQTDPAGVLVVGTNPHRKMDDEFSGFVGLIANQIAAGLANANAYSAERRRAEALAELDRAKTTFFSNVSHEFRTPLTLMLGPTEDALRSRHALTGEELERVHRNQLRLLKLVNALLDFSRLETGRIKAHYQPTDLALFTAELASVFRSAMKRAGLSFKVKTPPLPDTVYVDREMWEKIVLNLLSNALKSTFEGGVTVEMRSVGDHVELSVKDTGTGIAPEEIPNLFKRFFRIEHARRRTHEGSGIGLALVDELVRMHGGKITVSSQLDKGSTFTVSIPFGKSHLPAEAVVTHEAAASAAGAARSAFIQEAMSWLPEREHSASGTALVGGEHPPVAEQLDSPGGRVLLVDDNRDMREYVQKLLSGRFDVISAENGRAALEKALHDPPDIVVSDVMMPVMDGYELLAALRNAPATATVPVILLSARAGEESQVEGMEAGADDYLIKPFAARELIARVQAHLKIARFRKQAMQHELQLEKELQEAHRLATEAVENISDSFMAIDSDWHFAYLNPQARSLLRDAGAQGELLGKNLWETFPALPGTEFAEQYRRCMQERVPVQCESRFGERWYSARAYPSPTGIVIYAVDTTLRKTVEAELRLKQEHLLLTQKAVRIGTWELDVESEVLIISPEFAEIAGLSPQLSKLKYSDFLRSLFLSGDRKRSEEALQQALRRKKEFSIELRLKRPDGEVRLVSNRGKVFYNQGRPIVLGVLVDITSPESAVAEEMPALGKASAARRPKSKKKAKLKKTA